MSDENTVYESFNWVEVFFNQVSIDYRLASLLLSTIIYLIFVIFSLNVKIFKINSFYYCLESVSLSILVGYELAAIHYLLINLRTSLKDIAHYQLAISNDQEDPYYVIKQRLIKSPWYYVAIGSIILPLLAIDYGLYQSGDLPSFYNLSPAFSSILLDLYNFFLLYLADFLLGIIVWILLNMLFLFYEIGSNKYVSYINICIFSIDRIGGLESLKDLILKILVIYFTCISLAILSYTSPFTLLTRQSVFYIILLLLGILFFLVAFWSIRRYLRRRMWLKIHRLDKMYKEKQKQIFKIISKESHFEYRAQIDMLNGELDLISKCNETLMNLNYSIFDFGSMIKFITAFCLPVVTFIIKVYSLQT